MSIRKRIPHVLVLAAIVMLLADAIIFFASRNIILGALNVIVLFGFGMHVVAEMFEDWL